jgi:hypothetical protein
VAETTNNNGEHNTQLHCNLDTITIICDMCNEKKSRYLMLFVCLMVFNATFNNISVISWRPVLVVEEAGVPEQKNIFLHS